MGLFDFLKKKPQKPVNTQATPQEPKIQISVSVSTEQEDVLPIEKRIMDAAPTCDGLYPHEVLVLSYASSFCTNDTKFAGFWWYRYGIKDVPEILRSLERGGYIRTGTIVETVAHSTLPPIKVELSKLGLKTTGKKADLVNLLVENATEEQLRVAFPDCPYSLTEMGQGILDQYEWIPFIHRHRIEDLDIWNLTTMVQTPPFMSYRDKIWGYLNERGLVHFAANNYGLYSNCRLEMSDFVTEEKKFENAFRLLCEVASYDLSGLGNSINLRDFQAWLPHSYDSYFPYEKSIATVPPGIVTKFIKLFEELGWDRETRHSKTLEHLKKVFPPFSLFTPEECADIIILETEERKDDIAGIYMVAEKRFKGRYNIR